MPISYKICDIGEQRAHLVEHRASAMPSATRGCWEQAIRELCDVTTPAYRELMRYITEVGRIDSSNHDALLQCAQKCSPNRVELEQMVDQLKSKNLHRLYSTKDPAKQKKELERLYTNAVRLQFYETNNIECVNIWPDTKRHGAPALLVNIRQLIEDLGPIMVAGQFGPFFYTQGVFKKSQQQFHGVDVYFAPKGHYIYTDLQDCTSLETHNIIIVGLDTPNGAHDVKGYVYYIDPAYDRFNVVKDNPNKTFTARVYKMSFNLFYKRLFNIMGTRGDCYVPEGHCVVDAKLLIHDAGSTPPPYFVTSRDYGKLQQQAPS